ncbi:MAG: DNA primase [Candidatus Omnitrophica bacterium]|nr:DNA primase [Candidatus Omnitrophota bacterium]
MAGLIPDNCLEDILSRVNIVEVISAYVPLKRAGRNFKACCPFHEEKTPSFVVSADRQIYHCFGCGESGNAFKFLMRYERMEFLEAVELLAKKAGVILPESKKQDPAAVNFITQLYKLNELSGLFYENNLSLPSARLAKDYLLKRGLNEETIKLFKLGFVPDKWDMLLSHLRSKNISLSLMEKAGLVVPKDNGGYYDRYRNRIIFPILDPRERVIGFGARVLDNSLPKYINSPETPVYVKGRNLYGLNLSKDSIRELDFVVIVEGYLDVIVPFQAGLKNIVASSGTAFTPEQARLIKRYTSNVVVVYDGDAAGQIASLRSLEIFIEEEMNVKIVSLSEGLDPDSFVRKNGVDALREEISNAKSLFDYKLSILKSRFNYRNIDDKTKIAQAMLEILAKIKNAVLRSEYLKKLAQDLDIKEDALFQELKKFDTGKPSANPVAPNQRKQLNISPTEKLLIKLMLEENDLITRIKDSLHPRDFLDERSTKIVSHIFKLFDEGRSVEPNLLMSHLGSDDFSQLLCESIFMPDQLSSEEKEKVADDCVKRLKHEKSRQHRQSLEQEIKIAQNSGDEDKLQSLLQEFHGLIKKGVRI